MYVDVESKLTRMREYLIGSSANSNWNELYNMLWDAAIVELLKKVPELIDSDTVTESLISPIYYTRSLSWFSSIQCISIRRLIDNDKRAISLRRIMEMLSSIRIRLTRKVYMKYHGFDEYGETLRHKWENFLLKNGPGKWVKIPEDINYRYAEELMTRFDHACLVGEINRSDDDVIHIDLVNGLQKRLNQLSRVKNYVDKEIAHSEAFISNSANSNASRVTWGDLSQSRELIARVFFFLGAFLFDQGYAMLGSYAGDLEYDLFSKIAGPQHQELMQQTWQDYWKRVESYKSFDWTWVFANGD